LQFAAVLYGHKLFPNSLILPTSTHFTWVEIALGVLFIVGWMLVARAAKLIGDAEGVCIALAWTKG
jgi:hypothetical protein